VVQKLLQAGFKVVAGVGDEESAQAAVDFATSVELLRKQEVQKLRLAEIHLGDEESIIAVLPKCVLVPQHLRMFFRTGFVVAGRGEGRRV